MFKYTNNGLSFVNAQTAKNNNTNTADTHTTGMVSVGANNPPLISGPATVPTGNSTAALDNHQKKVASLSSSFNLASIKATAFNMALNMGISLVITTALNLIIRSIDNYIHANERALEAADKAKTKINEIRDNYNSQKQLVEECADEYDRLSQGVNKLTNENVSLSTDDYERFLNINKQLSDAFPQLTSTIASNGSAILTLGSRGRTASADLKALLKAEQDLHNFRIAEQLDDTYKGVKVVAEEALKSNSSYSRTSKHQEKYLNEINNLKKIRFGKQVTLSGDLTEMGAAEYKTAISKVVTEFNKKLDPVRRTALDGAFDLANILRAEDTGLFEFKFPTRLLTSDEIDVLSGLFKSESKKMARILTDTMGDSFRSNSEKNNAAKLAWQDFISDLVSATHSKEAFKGLGEGGQNLATYMIENLDYDVVNLVDDQKIYDYIRETILAPLSNLSEQDDQTINDALKKLFKIDVDSLSIDKAKEDIDDQIKAIAEILNQDDETIRIALGFEFVDDLHSKYESVIQKGAGKFSGDTSHLEKHDYSKEIGRLDYLHHSGKTSDFTAEKKRLLAMMEEDKTPSQKYTNEYDKLVNFAKENSINTQEEIDFLNQCIEESKDLDEAIKRYINSSSKSTDKTTKDFDISSEVSTSKIDNFQSEMGMLSSALDKVKNKQLSDSELLDLIQQFPELADKTDDLSGALEDLIDGKLNNITDFLQQAGASDSLIETFKKIAEEAKNFATAWEDAFRVFDNTDSVMNSLAELTTALGSNYTLTADEARRFSEVFPEILAQGEVTSDGLIQLNKDQVDNFITNKQAELQADQETLIIELENKKASLQAQKGLAQAELDLLAAQKQAEIDGTNQTNEALSEAEKNFVQYLVDLGVEETNAQALCEEVKAGNVQEYDRVVAEVSENVHSNMSESASGAAVNISEQARSMIASLHSIAKQAFNTAKSILSVGTDNPFEAAKEILGNVGEAIHDFAPKVINTIFKKQDAIPLDVTGYQEVDREVKLELDIQNYDKAIAETDAQIALIKAKGSQSLDAYRPKGSGGGSGGNAGNASPSSEPEEKKQEFDWKERLDARQEKSLNEIKEKLSDSSLSYETQLALIDELIKKEQERLDTAQKAALLYTTAWTEAQDKIRQAAAEQGLDGNEIIANIMNGNLNNEEYSGEALIDSIESGIDIYDKFTDNDERSKKSLKEIEDQLKEQLKIRLDIVKAQTQAIEAEASILSSEIDLTRALGAEVSEGQLRDQIRLSEDLIDSYHDQIDTLYDQLDAVDDGSEEYYSLLSQINSCENSILQCKIQQAEWNDQIKRLPIEKIQRILNILGHVKTDLENFVNEQNALGIDTTKDQFQQFVELSQQEMDQLLKQQKLLSDLLNDYEFNTDKYNDTASQIQDIDNAISQLIQSQHEWNQAILNIPVNNISKANEKLQDISNTMGDLIAGYDTVINAVNGAVDKQIESINELREASEQAYQEQIDPLQEQLDLLQKQNEERQIQLGLEQARYNLERAQNQRTTQVIRNGELVYEANAEEVRNAQNSLQDAEYNKLIHDLEKQINDLNDDHDSLLEGYDEQLEKLEKIKEKWSSISADIQLAADSLKADAVLGSGWKDNILSGDDTALYEKLKELYSSMTGQKSQYDEQLASNEKIAALMQQYISAWTNGSMTYDEAMKHINDLIAKMDQGFTADEYLDSLIGINDGTSLSSVLANIQSSVKDSAGEFKSYFDLVQKNNDALGNYTSTWEQIQKNLEEQVNALKQAAGLLEQNLDNIGDSISRQFFKIFSFSAAQKEHLLSNIGGSPNPAFIAPNAGNSASAAPSVNKPNFEVNMQFGNLNLPNVTNGDDFARFLNGNLDSAVTQHLGKWS